MQTIEKKQEYRQYRRDWVDNPKNCIVSQFPLHLDVELTNKCNLSCDMCPFHGPDAINKREPQDMDFELYKKIIDEGSKKGLKSIKLNYGGEPLLYPQLPEAIKYAKDAGILDIQLNTNGMLIYTNLLKSIIQSGLDLLILTDYDIPHQYGVTVAIHLHKKIYNLKKPIIRMKSNNPEKWEDYVDEVVPNVYYDYNHPIDDITSSEFKCSQPWQRMLILSDGSMCKCSCGSLNESKMFGNINDFTIEEIWKSTKMKFLRMCHESKMTHLVRMCRSCPARNEYIKELKDAE